MVELQTNFGGGKTHSMLALYHLCGDIPPAELAGMDVVLRDTNITRLPPVRRAVLVGTALSPAKRYTKPDGIVVSTLWGELAYQLLGKKGYALVAEADQAGVNLGPRHCRRFWPSPPLPPLPRAGEGERTPEKPCRSTGKNRLSPLSRSAGEGVRG